jgi:hypothetical protein
MNKLDLSKALKKTIDAMNNDDIKYSNETHSDSRWNIKFRLERAAFRLNHLNPIEYIKELTDIKHNILAQKGIISMGYSKENQTTLQNRINDLLKQIDIFLNTPKEEEDLLSSFVVIPPATNIPEEKDTNSHMAQVWNRIGSILPLSFFSSTNKDIKPSQEQGIIGPKL